MYAAEYCIRKFPLREIHAPVTAPAAERLVEIISTAPSVEGSARVSSEVLPEPMNPPIARNSVSWVYIAPNRGITRNSGERNEG